MSADGSPVLPQMTLPTGNQATIAQVIAAIEIAPDLSPRCRAEICSACRILCAWLGSDPASVPAGPRLLRKRFESLSFAKVGVTKGRFANVRSLVLKALKHAGIRSMPGRAREPLAAEWEVLRARLPDRHFKYGLSRFMSFCTTHGITPHAVALTILRGLVETVELHPTEDGFDIDFRGEIAKMIALPNRANDRNIEHFRISAKRVSGERNQRYLQAFLARIPRAGRPLKAVTGVRIP